MKQIYFIASSLFLTINLIAQSIPEKANTMLVTFSDSNNLSTKLVTAFEKNNYIVKNLKKSRVHITSEPKSLKANTRVAMTADLSGYVIALSARLVYTGQDPVKVEYNGKKGTPVLIGWEEMEKVAKSLEGVITYERK